MKKGMKIATWTGFGLVLVGLMSMAAQNGAMMSLNGKSLVQEANNEASFGAIEPAAGESPQATLCGDYPDWIGKAVDEEAVKQTGKPYRILKPGSMMTMDYRSDRINVLIDEDGIVTDVRCG